MRAGTCLACGHVVPIVNYRVERFGEVGYLGRHSRQGVAGGKDRVPRKCRGSFNDWAERKHTNQENRS
jgi:hypothetical protein